MQLKNLALIVAAGKGERFGGDVPKQYAMLGGRSVLRWSVEAFLRHPGIDLVRVVIADGDSRYRELGLVHEKLLPPVIGGAARQESVRLGLMGLSGVGKVLIHDAARPFVTEKIITDCLTALDLHQAVVPVVGARDSVRVAGVAVARDAVKLVQTPQGFLFDVILAAHNLTPTQPSPACGGGLRWGLATDDAQLVEAMGVEVFMIEGDEVNKKITVQSDLKSHPALDAGSHEEIPHQVRDVVNGVRVGTGFDVHGFEDGDGVIICGVKIPFHKKLKGHSDADVGIHALVDAVLGAIGEGDIGDHFPPSDVRWKGADSIRFLEYAVEMVAARNAVINNVDVTIICEEPKLAEYKLQMKKRLAEILEIGEERVNVKATTTEKLGFTGRKEGIAAQAVASVNFLG